MLNEYDYACPEYENTAIMYTQTPLTVQAEAGTGLSPDYLALYAHVVWHCETTCTMPLDIAFDYTQVF